MQRKELIRRDRQDLARQVVIVVRAGETEHQAVLDAIALVDKGAPVCAVLNRCEPSVLNRYYGRYYYGYGYGRYGNYGSRAESGASRESSSSDTGS